MSIAVGLWVIMGLPLVCGIAGAPGWDQWRGPGRSAVSPEASGWPEGWPPRRLWGGNVGKGCTSPIVVQGRVYVMGWKGKTGANPVGTDTVSCLHARTGEVLWKQSYRARYQSRVRTGDTGGYGGPSATPALDRQTQYLYTLGVDGDLRCWDANHGGRKVWARNLYDDYKVPQRPNVGKDRKDYGFISSPLVQGELVIVEVGDDEGTVMAFDKKAGRRRWASALREPAGHSSGPVPLTVRGVPCLATLTMRKLVVMRTDKGHEGETVTTFPWRTDYACNIPTPVVLDNKVVLTSSYNVGKTAMIEIAPEGAGKRWDSRHHALLSSPVLYKGCVYLVNGQVKCLNLATGALRWRGGSFGHGSIAIASGDDKAVVFGSHRLVLLDVSPGAKEYRELARIDKVVPGTCYPHVCLSGGLVLCKDREGNLVCYSVGGGSAIPPRPEQGQPDKPKPTLRGTPDAPGGR